MGEPRLSKILIGTLFIGLVSLAVMLFLSGGAQEYEIAGYTNSSLEAFTNTSNEIEDIGHAAEGNLSATGASQSGNFDIFGGFFSNAWTALKSTWNSITTIGKISNQAVDELPGINTQFRNQLKTFLVVAVLIVLVIAIFFHFIKGSSRL